MHYRGAIGRVIRALRQKHLAVPQNNREERSRLWHLILTAKRFYWTSAGQDYNDQFNWSTQRNFVPKNSPEWARLKTMFSDDERLIEDFFIYEQQHPTGI